MNYQGEQINQLLGTIRKRLYLLKLLRGGAITMVVIAASLIVSGLAAYKYRFNTGALVTLRIVCLLTLIASVYFLIIRPIRRRYADAQLARLVEERHGSLDDRLVSAVEFSDAGPVGASPAIVDRLVTDAGERARVIDPGEIVPRKRFWQ